MQYFMLRLAALFWRATFTPDLATQIVMQDNFVAFMNTVTSINTVLKASVLDVIQSIASQSLIIMIAVITSVIFLGFVILPLYYHIQTQNEEILKLFATLSSQTLSDMYIPIQISLNQHKQGRNKLATFNDFKKRKAISVTSVLPKVKKMHIVYISIGISLMIIQPIVSFIYIRMFYDEATIITDLILNLYYAKPFMASSQAVNYSMIVYVLGTFGIYNPAYYTSRLGSLNSSASQTI